jgi:hypothetical protein
MHYSVSVHKIKHSIMTYELIEKLDMIAFATVL